MIKARKIYCKNCGKVTTHYYAGRKTYSLLPLWSYKYWACSDCHELHEQDTAYPETKYN